jgi:hypothetical protein
MQAILDECAGLNHDAFLCHTYIDADLTKCDARKREGCAVFIKMRFGGILPEADAEIPGSLIMRRGFYWQGVGKE